MVSLLRQQAENRTLSACRLIRIDSDRTFVDDESFLRRPLLPLRERCHSVENGDQARNAEL
tara:strand:- start:7864 stop:8046 length:183 start_codon:yes stop_codon:yes gene_type:complete